MRLTCSQSDVGSSADTRVAPDEKKMRGGLHELSNATERGEVVVRGATTRFSLQEKAEDGDVSAAMSLVHRWGRLCSCVGRVRE